MPEIIIEQGQEIINYINMLNLAYKISEYSLPQNFKLYLRKQFFGNKAKKYFWKNKIQ